MNRKILIVASIYYKDISTGLISGSKYILEKKNIDFETIYVPGTFEISLAIKHYIDQYDGFVALGCVIKGKTPHFNLISNASTNAIMKLSIDHKKPVGNGIITCLNMKQAIMRGKKGSEASKAVISVLKQ